MITKTAKQTVSKANTVKRDRLEDAAMAGGVGVGTAVGSLTAAGKAASGLTGMEGLKDSLSDAEYDKLLKR